MKRENGILHYFYSLSVIAGVGLMLLVVCEICFRVLFSHSFGFALPLEQLLLMAIGFISLGSTWKSGQFICVDFFVARMSRRSQLVLSIISIVLSLTCSVILLWLGTESAVRSLNGGERPTSINMPLGVWKLMIPLGLGVLIIELIVSLIREVKKLTLKEKAV
jgi:TRAP-type C4-dicarboxylate transport system permease small subunit